MSVATAGLAPPRTCDGTVTINATNPDTGAAAVGSPLTIRVKLYVSTSAQLVLTPANLQPFHRRRGRAIPGAADLTLTSTSTDVLNYTVAFQSNTGNWLFVGLRADPRALTTSLPSP